jgi:hypothetical protein
MSSSAVKGQGPIYRLSYEIGTCLSFMIQAYLMIL